MSIPDNEKYSLKSIRFVEIGFDIVKDGGNHFRLYKGDKMIGTVVKSELPDKTLSKMTSLCEWEPNHGISRPKN